MRVALDNEDVEAIATRVVELLRDELRHRAPAGWLDAKSAATYAGCSVNALHKATASREVRFAQDAPGGKCWLKREWIDQWRGL